MDFINFNKMDFLLNYFFLLYEEEIDGKKKLCSIRINKKTVHRTHKSGTLSYPNKPASHTKPIKMKNKKKVGVIIIMIAITIIITIIIIYYY
jgi:hypothetical protein